MCNLSKIPQIWIFINLFIISTLILVYDLFVDHMMQKVSEK